MAITASSKLSEVFAIIAKNKAINLRPNCRVLGYQLVNVLTKQHYLIGLPTNRPIFPGTSHFSAYMPHVPALANICPAMYNVPIFQQGW
jgi:hypothetical protein